MIQNLLLTLGLNLTEQQILLKLLERGPTTAHLLASATKIKRTTVYTVLENLVKIGIVTRQKQFGSSYFSSLQPEMVCKILENKNLRDFEEKNLAAKLLRENLKEIKTAPSNYYGSFKVEAVASLEFAFAQLEQAFYAGFKSIFNPAYAHKDESKKFVKNFVKKPMKAKQPLKTL